MNEEYLPVEICTRLFEAGLPKPDPAPYQKWYRPKAKKPYIILRTVAARNLVIFYDAHIEGCFQTDADLFSDFEIYCPDAEYILAHLPPGYVIQKHNGHYQFGDQYAVFNLSSVFIADAAISAVRAAADVYLSINDKT